MYDPWWSFSLNRTVRRTRTCGTPAQSTPVTGNITSRLWAGTRGTGWHTARPYRLHITLLCTLCFPTPHLAMQTGRMRRWWTESLQGDSGRKRKTNLGLRQRARKKVSLNMMSAKWTSRLSCGSTLLRRSATERNWVCVFKIVTCQSRWHQPTMAVCELMFAGVLRQHFFFYPSVWCCPLTQQLKKSPVGWLHMSHDNLYPPHLVAKCVIHIHGGWQTAGDQ